MSVCCYLVRCLLPRIPEEAQGGSEHSDHQPRREEDRNCGACDGGMDGPRGRNREGCLKGKMISSGAPCHSGHLDLQVLFGGSQPFGDINKWGLSRGETGERWAGTLSTVRIEPGASGKAA